ncbi:hypothetical protein HDE_00043 [Halotydeus destructor]|nr:hypothetical protein HDE_00043 [Halotydeus destructor]
MSLTWPAAPQEKSNSQQHQQVSSTTGNSLLSASNHSAGNSINIANIISTSSQLYHHALHHHLQLPELRELSSTDLNFLEESLLDGGVGTGASLCDLDTILDGLSADTHFLLTNPDQLLDGKQVAASQEREKKFLEATALPPGE